MTDLLKIHKINAPLPSQLEPNSIYYVKDGNSLKQYVTNSTGDLSYTTYPGSELDLKAPLNSPTFTGQLILPNNSRINNIEHFYQTTKPTTRGDGSALVVGDRWWKPDEGTEWFWNGTYWVSPRIVVPFSTHSLPGFSSTSIYSFSSHIPQPSTDNAAVLIESCVITIQTNTSNYASYTVTNDWIVALHTADNVLPNYSSQIQGTSFKLSDLKRVTPASTSELTVFRHKVNNLNYYLDVSSPNADTVKWVNLAGTKINTPPNIAGCNYSITYRQIA